MRADFTFLVLLLWLFSVCFSFIIITLIVSLASSSSSVVHHPSKDRAAPPVFCLILCRMNFWWLEKSKFSSSSSFVFYSFILCHMASKGTSLPPTSPFSIQHREMNGNKIFSCHHPFLALCRQPHSVSRKLCVRMTPPCRPSERYPDPTPSIPTHPTFLLLAFLHIHVCLNADGIKRLLLPQSISVFLFYLLLQVEGICGMHSCTGLYRSSVD